MKKFLSVILVLALVLSLGAITFAEEKLFHDDFPF